MTMLYFTPGTCALAPHIVLEWVGGPYQAIKVDYKDPAYKAINPLAAVPAMDDGFGVMTQADAILKYLAAKHPEAQLDAGNDRRGAYELDRWLAFLTGDLHPAYYPLFSPQRYTTDEGGTEEVKAAGAKLVSKFLYHLDGHLKGRDHVALAYRNVADAYAFAMVRWAPRLLPGGLEPFPQILRFHDRMEEDAGVKAALAAQG